MHVVVFYNHAMKSFIKVRAEKLIFCGIQSQLQNSKR